MEKASGNKLLLICINISSNTLEELNICAGRKLRAG